MLPAGGRNQSDCRSNQAILTLFGTCGGLGYFASFEYSSCLCPSLGNYTTVFHDSQLPLPLVVATNPGAQKTLSRTDLWDNNTLPSSAFLSEQSSQVVSKIMWLHSVNCTKPLKRFHFACPNYKAQRVPLHLLSVFDPCLDVDASQQ